MLFHMRQRLACASCHDGEPTLCRPATPGDAPLHASMVLHHPLMPMPVPVWQLFTQVMCSHMRCMQPFSSCSNAGPVARDMAPEDNGTDHICGGGVADCAEQIRYIACVDAQRHQGVHCNLKWRNHHTLLCLQASGNPINSRSMEREQASKARYERTCQVLGVAQSCVVVVVRGVAGIQAKLLGVRIVNWQPVLHPAASPEGNSHIESPALQQQ